MNWIVYCADSQYSQFAQECHHAGFTIQLHSDTLERCETGVPLVYRLVISHQCSHALTLLLMRTELNLRVADE